jgi:hypothetical protein
MAFSLLSEDDAIYQILESASAYQRRASKDKRLEFTV